LNSRLLNGRLGYIDLLTAYYYRVYILKESRGISAQGDSEHTLGTSAEVGCVVVGIPGIIRGANFLFQLRWIYFGDKKFVNIV